MVTNKHGQPVDKVSLECAKQTFDAGARVYRLRRVLRLRLRSRSGGRAAKIFPERRPAFMASRFHE